MKNYFKNLYYGAFLLMCKLHRCARYIVYPFAKLLSIVLGLLPPFKQGLEKQNITAEENFNRVWKMGRRFANDDFIGSQRRTAAEFLAFFFFFSIFDIVIILKRIFGAKGILYYMTLRFAWPVCVLFVLLSGAITTFLTNKYEDMSKLKAFRKKSKKVQYKALFTFIGSFILSLILFFIFFILWNHPHR